MGSTGEPDRKRRHVSSIPPTGATAAKKQPLFPCSSEDKKLDVAVLQYQNQKLVQQVEAQKIEYLVSENKFHCLREKQKSYDDTLTVINNSWERLVNDLEKVAPPTNGSTNDGHALPSSRMSEDKATCPMEDDFLSRLLETGATESCSDMPPPIMGDEVLVTRATTEHVLHRVIYSINDMWHVNNGLFASHLVSVPENELCRQLQKTTTDLHMEVSNFLIAIRELHLKHRMLADKVQSHRDTDAMNKAEHKRLAEEVANTTAELKESKQKLAILKAQRDNVKGGPFLFPTLGNKLVGGEKVRDKHKEMQEMESTLKDLMDLVSTRMVEVRSLHEERTHTIKKLAELQNALMDAKRIFSSKAYLLLVDQLEKSKSEMDQYRSSLEKLQVEKDNFVWREKEVNMRLDIADVSQRLSAVSLSRIAGIEHDLHKLVRVRMQLEAKLQDASREPGTKEIIADFKAHVASLPKDTKIMQSQLSKYKEAASGLHVLRAEVQSVANILQRKAIELESFSARSANQLSEIKILQSLVRDLRTTNHELKLMLEMYRRESTDSRDVMESKDMEYKSWAHVQSLKSHLDEHNLELRVKAANEAESLSQQRLATAEAEIAELRQKMEASGKDISDLSEVLKSKNEEGEGYLSEIESIGQAYEDMQTQNQHLLQQVTERDDYNIQLYMEGVKARQLHDLMRTDIQRMDKEIYQANSLMDLYDVKVARLDDQLRIWSEHAGKFVEDGWQSSVALENSQRRLLDVRTESQQLRQTLDGVQNKVRSSRLDVAELLVELEKERYNRRRSEEELEVMSRKAACLRAQTEGSTHLQKLKQEIREYRGILKCGICCDWQKEVVIAKCYHLFCSRCIQSTLESRHRRCPTCSMSFGANDVKPIYI